MTQLLHIPTDLIGDVWPQVGPVLAKAVARYANSYDMSHVRARLDAGDVALWVVMDGVELKAAFTTDEIIYPKRKIMLVELLGGAEAKMWYYDTVKRLAEIARSTGYDAIQTTARRGWSKMAKECGFNEAAVTYEMEL